MVTGVQTCALRLGADQVLVMGRPAPDRPAGVLRRGTHAALADHDDAYRWALSQEEQ